MVCDELVGFGTSATPRPGGIAAGLRGALGVGDGDAGAAGIAEGAVLTGSPVVPPPPSGVLDVVSDGMVGV